MLVRAPAHGVVFAYSWSSIRFELRGNLGSEDEGRLILRTRALYSSNEGTFIPEYWSTQFPLSGDEPTFVIQAPSDVQILGEVMFPGRELVPLDFSTPAPGGEAQALRSGSSRPLSLAQGAVRARRNPTLPLGPGGRWL